MTTSHGRPGGSGGVVLAAHPSAELYGSDRMFLESVVGLVQSGRQVVATLPGTGPLVELLTAAGAKVVVVPAPVLRKSAVTPTGFVRLARDAALGVARGWNLVRGADVVYVSTLTIPLWVGLAALARRPSVCHVHEAEGSAPAVLRHAMALPLELTTGLLVNSGFARDVLARSSARSGRRASIVLNGVAGPERPTDPRSELVDPVRVLFVGRLSPRKGVDVAVEALVDLTVRGVDATLDVLGAVYPGYEWFEVQLRERVTAAGVADRVTFHGFHPDVWGFAASCDVVVVPSRSDEPFGNTAVEAVLARRPVIVSDTSGLREASAGYESAQAVPPGDAGALADAVERVRSDWTDFRDGAVRDAAVAAERHSLDAYRGVVVREVAAVTRCPGSQVRAAEPEPPSSLVVAVLTYRRPDELAALLPVLAAQAAACRLPADVLVVDNDPAGSAREVVERVGLPGVRYVNETTPGIAAARNTALAQAAADVLVFIDDDEVPVEGWLDHLVGEHARTGATAVVGPVVSRFRGEPHPWVAAGRFFDRRRLATGTPVDVAATNNLLLDMRQVRSFGLEFDERFGLSGGSDTLFTRQLVHDGGSVVWCDEAVVFDEVPGERLTTAWVLRRALRSGNSWSRTSVELAGPPRKLSHVRLSLLGAGAVRLIGGTGFVALGLVRRDASRQARGARTAARGAGMALGALGWVYHEYRRRPVSATPGPRRPSSAGERP